MIILFHRLKMTVAAKNIICDKTFSFKINNSLHTKKKEKFMTQII